MRNRNRSRGSLVGLAVGDALGAHVEFKDHGTYPRLTDYQAGGTFNLQPGQYTDDTSQAFCLAETLLAHQGFDETDFLTRLLRWLREGYNSSTGVAFDIGRGTRKVLEEFEAHGVANLSTLENSGGNGALMRLAPAVIAAPDVYRATRLARLSSLATHQHILANRCAVVFSQWLFYALSENWFQPEFAGRTRKQSLESYQQALETNGLGLTNAFLALGVTAESLSTPVLNCSGFCVNSLVATYQCFFGATSFEDAVVDAVNRGGDTDTVGAMVGQLAGAFYGYNEIPERWLAVQDHDRLVQTADQLAELNPT